MQCQMGWNSAARSQSHSLANSVAEGPSPPAQSPTTTRVKPTAGCSVRHDSISRSKAALLVA